MLVLMLIPMLGLLLVQGRCFTFLQLILMLVLMLIPMLVLLLVQGRSFTFLPFESFVFT